MPHDLSPKMRAAMFEALSSSRWITRTLNHYNHEGYTYERWRILAEYLACPGSPEWDQIQALHPHELSRRVRNEVSLRGQPIIDLVAAYTGVSWFAVADIAHELGPGYEYGTYKRMLDYDRAEPRIHQGQYALHTVAQHVRQKESESRDE